jgi:predicted ATPase
LATVDATAPLLVVGSYRHQGVEAGHPLLEAAAYLCKERLMQRVHLTGLTADESLTLVRERVPGFDPVLAARLHRRTGGNPYLLEELARGLAEGAAGASRTWVPETVTEVVRDRLARVSPRARQVLQAAGVLGLAFSFGDVSAVTGLGGPSLLDALDEGVGAGVIAEAAGGAFAFTPPVIRDVVVGAMTAARCDALRDRVPQDRAATLMLAE